MRPTLDSSLGQTLLEASHARERAKEHESSRELWLSAVAQTLVEQVPRLSLPPPDAELSLAALNAPSEAPGLNPALGASEASAGGDAAEAASTQAWRGVGRAPGADAGVPAALSAEVSDERFGRLTLQVARGERGLDIVINVADAHVKALIIAEQLALVKTLKDAGLVVASFQIGGAPRAGTALALYKPGLEKARLNAGFQETSARRRTYEAALPEEDAGDGVDFTA